MEVGVQVLFFTEEYQEMSGYSHPLYVQRCTLLCPQHTCQVSSLKEDELPFWAIRIQKQIRFSFLLHRLGPGWRWAGVTFARERESESSEGGVVMGTGKARETLKLDFQGRHLHLGFRQV